MKKAIILILAIFTLSACAVVPIREGVSGINSTPIYDGDCVYDHFPQYFACASERAGGSDE
jgi:hypothetical protein